MSAGARVGLIIVTYNSRTHFPRLKAAIEQQTARFELFVIDNASRAEQRPAAGDFPAGAHIMQMEENIGFAAANNKAAALFGGEFLALLNPDAFPDRDWLAHLLDAAARWPDAVAFGSTQISANDERVYDGLGDCYSIIGVPWRGGFGWPRDTPLQEGEVFSPCAAAALYRNAAWQAAGGFDETFFCYGEDVDLGFRLRLAGGSCVQVAGAIVRHVGGASSGRRSEFAIYHGRRNRLWTYVKNMPAPLLLISLPAHILVTLTLLLVSPFRGSGRPTWGGIGAAIAGLGKVWSRRTPRRASLQAIARAISWRPDALVTRAPQVRTDQRAPRRNKKGAP